MVVDHEDLLAHRLGHVAHRSELGPRTRVEHDEHVAAHEVVLLHSLGERFEPVVGVDPLQVRRRGLGVDDPHVLADGLQDAEHPQFTAEGVAVGPHVAREHERPRVAKHSENGRPIKSHVCSSALENRQAAC